ncbi:MAG TPA: hypothetical protein VNO30_40720 [Kofleriaceae bacterium]|nr:hypothetical protein [Kofleriaceae bacterium]
MLSIRFDDEHEWWVSDQVFDRLFTSALAHGQLAMALEEWRDVAAANGGFSMSGIDPGVARDLTAGLRAAASAELARLDVVDLQTDDGTYKASLEKLLAIMKANQDS